MKKIKGIAVFLVIFLAILFLNYLFYKNINIFLRTQEKELYSFESNTQKEQKELLYEIYEQVLMQNNYKKIDEEEVDEITKNNIIYNLIKNTIYKNVDEKEIELMANYILSIGELSNTIYGNLKVVSDLEISKIGRWMNFLILYSEDMKKIYYLNINAESESYEKDQTVSEIQSEGNVIFDEKNENISQYDKRSKEELVNNCKSSMLNLIKNIEFEPDTIIYKGNCYILKDSKRSITVYYNSIDNIIFGMHIGFEK